MLEALLEFANGVEAGLVNLVVDLFEVCRAFLKLSGTVGKQVLC